MEAGSHQRDSAIITPALAASGNLCVLPAACISPDFVLFIYSVGESPRGGEETIPPGGLT